MNLFICYYQGLQGKLAKDREVSVKLFKDPMYCSVQLGATVRRSRNTLMFLTAAYFTYTIFHLGAHFCCWTV